MAARVNGPLHWTQVGREGRPIVFVHPNPMDWVCWLYQMGHLSTWFRTMAVDLPGYGRSPTVEPGVTPMDLAAACWEAVDAFTSEPVILVGESLGHTVALHMASQRQGQTLALALSGASYHTVKTSAFRRMQQYTENGITFRHQHTLEDFSPAFRQTPMARYFAELFSERNEWADLDTIVEMFRSRTVPDCDPDWLYESIQTPTIIITGSEDPAHQAAFPLQERIKGCELVTIEGAGHSCNMEQPWEWDKHFLDFLGRHGLFDGQTQPRTESLVS